MFSLRSLCAALAILSLAQFAAAQTAVNSTFLDRYPASSYSDPSNWSPAEVPNNSDAKHYNVNISVGYGVDVDTNATISNLTLAGAFTGLRVIDKTLTVTGNTQHLFDGNGEIKIFSSPTAAAAFNAGTLSTFSNHALSGSYALNSGGSPATLQFNGADIFTLSDGYFSLAGTFARIVDEFGNDAFRNLALIEPAANLYVTGQSFLTNAPLKIEGTLTLGPGPTTFTAAGSLTNFDPATRTMNGGQFRLFANYDPAIAPVSPVELRFNGADIVNLGSFLQLRGTTARIADSAGNDGLRNLGRILPGGTLLLEERAFTAVGQFTNEGLLSLFAQSIFAVPVSLGNFNGTTKTLSGGKFTLSSSTLKFAGADIVRNGSSLSLTRDGAITDLAGNDALRNFAENLNGGEFVLSHSYHFTSSGDFTNAGRVVTVPYIRQTRAEFHPGIFTVASGFSYIQTAGETVNDGYLIADHLDIQGGTFTGRGTTQGDVTVTNATIQPGVYSTIDGDLTLGSGSHFRWGYTYANPNVISGKVTLAGTLEIDIRSEQFIGSTLVLPVLRSAQSLVGAFSNAPNGARIPTVDGKGSVEVRYDTRAIYVTRYHAEPPPAQLLNISSRGFLSRSADNPAGDRSVLIGGFMVVGNYEAKEVVLRGLGPSLSGFAPNAVLADPVLELRSANGALLATNDNWADTQPDAISSSGLAPAHEREAAIRATLLPAPYTVVLKEKNGLGGNGVVEIYDISNSSITKLANISTRGITDSGNLLIGGMIAGGEGQANADIVVRALGPQMKTIGVPNAIDDPTLEVRDHNGVVVAFNDDWPTNSEQLNSTGLAPLHSQEPAMRLSLPGGNYTAIVRAKGTTGGVGLVEFYDLRR